MDHPHQRIVLDWGAHLPPNHQNSLNQHLLHRLSFFYRLFCSLSYLQNSNSILAGTKVKRPCNNSQTIQKRIITASHTDRNGTISYCWYLICGYKLGSHLLSPIRSLYQRRSDYLRNTFLGNEYYSKIYYCIYYNQK